MILDTVELTDYELYARLFTITGVAWQEMTDDYLPKEQIKGKTVAAGIWLARGVGYASFFVDFYFDEEGNLIDHGVWE